ncbi:hypothetical protein MCOR27_003592 [Pyricularia oryzae]|nr:hypothetical protein MCOR01_000276 [Pyricularia oryzae]KAI6254492.1 hypothetical protein MCOR19_009017 [Pyricularia oryzae]KAI6266592.1 hypothetical protein MCOR26_010112 [Pyricularia oryzae]KAI6282828.1 hypothetical protein MCOR27_003592 [Pyricularia oryzae]KAI6310723.1 hypothetical protein MCOR29_008522 [Pyricularia oryzae]
MQLTRFLSAWLLPAMAMAQTTTFQTSTTTATATAPATPSPTMPGLAPNCDGFHKLESGDNCYEVAAKYGITMTQLYAWNTVVNDTCSNLLAGYYMCVHVPGAEAPTKPEPQMPGVVENCQKFYQIKAGDGCWSIYTEAGITYEQLRSWNTGIDAACGNLWPDFYVCIGV